jgi:hypothetical protein
MNNGNKKFARLTKGRDGYPAGERSGGHYGNYDRPEQEQRISPKEMGGKTV